MKKPYSHVARGLTLYDEVNMYYQANEGKVNYEEERVFSKKHEIVKEYTIQIPEDEYLKISKACVKEAGQPYGVWQNIGIVLVKVMNMLGKNMENPWKQGKNCSELIYTEVLKSLFPELDYNPNLIEPKDIENIVIERFGNTKQNLWTIK